MTASYQARVAAIAKTNASYRTNAVIPLVTALVMAVVVSAMGAWFIAPPVLGLGAAIAAFMWRVAARFERLPVELLERGRPTPAVIVSAHPVGPGMRAAGFPDGERAQQRALLRIEVRPPSEPAYPIVLTTFDAPRPRGLEGRSLTVYVDPADPRRICPDWSTFDAEY